MFSLVNRNLIRSPKENMKIEIVKPKPPAPTITLSCSTEELKAINAAVGAASAIGMGVDYTAAHRLYRTLADAVAQL